METYVEYPSICTLLEGHIGGDYGSSEETLMPPGRGGRGRSGKPSWRKWPWINYGRMSRI